MKIDSVSVRKGWVLTRGIPVAMTSSQGPPRWPEIPISTPMQCTAQFSSSTPAWDPKRRDSGGRLLGATKNFGIDRAAFSWSTPWSETEASRPTSGGGQNKGMGWTEGPQWRSSATFQMENQIPVETRENECPSPTISHGLLDSQPHVSTSGEGPSLWSFSHGS